MTLAKGRGMTTFLVGHVTAKGPWPAPGSSSTWWIPCCTSKASNTTRTGCCGP